MAEKGKRIRSPLYFKEFECIGGDCEDNCCIGWDVEIDKKTYQNYNKVKDSELLPLFKKFIYKNADYYNEKVDYAVVELVNNNKCPFLNDKHLCKIQSKLGHDFLSNVCATYPRYSNEVDGVLEYSANISCPEAAKLILMNKDGIKFTEEMENTTQRVIVNCVLNSKNHDENIMVKYFQQLRSFTISVLQDRKYLIWQRIYILGVFYNALRGSCNIRKDFDVNDLISDYTKKIKGNELRPEMERINIDYNLQLGIFREITDKKLEFTEIDSKEYINYTQEFLKGLRISKNSTFKEEVKSYCNAYTDYYEPFMKDHEYLLENYLVNFVFGDLFPAAESADPFEAYIRLVLRYILIKCKLIGISGFRKGLTEKDCVRFIQVFSKAIEHHNTYLDGIAAYMKKKKYNNMAVINIFLKN